MGYSGGILKYVQNLYNSKKLDILYYILRTCDSFGKESFLARATEFENSVDSSLFSISKKVFVSFETRTSYECRKFCKEYCSLKLCNYQAKLKATDTLNRGLFHISLTILMTNEVLWVWKWCISYIWFCNGVQIRLSSLKCLQRF